MNHSTGNHVSNRNTGKALASDVLKNWVVLIVDDQPDNVLVAKVALKFQGAQIYTAANGEEGLKAIQSIRPTLVLLDISMPIMDGWEMHRRLRENPDTATIPVVALTAHAMDGDEARVLEAGFDGYIAKPFDVTTLASKLQTILERIGISSKS